jgi:NAD(P)-dependent dehydrogenase (short-subunit alcohol dehydrogenase family)
MMPALAREIAQRNHNLVIANVVEGLVDELTSLGVEVEAIPDRVDLGQPGTFQKLVDAAIERFGHFDSACIRTGAHRTGTILDATVEESQQLYEGNFLQAFRWRGHGQTAQFFAIDAGWAEE